MPALLIVAGRLTLTASLFVVLFLSIFWTPGLLLAFFALAYAADTRAFSPAADRRRRAELLVASLRRYRGGWLDSPTTAG
jgi:hypothetical protein